MGNYIGRVEFLNRKDKNHRIKAEFYKDDQIFTDPGPEENKLSTPEFNVLHQTNNRLNSTGSDYSNGLNMNRATRNSTESEAEIKDKKENLYWSAKLKELETYSSWDKQYILDTMLRDAVILLRPVEVRKLIEIGANINCNQFPQFESSNAKKSIYNYALETKSDEIIEILKSAGCNMT